MIRAVQALAVLSVALTSCQSRHVISRECATTNTSGDFPESITFERSGSVVLRFWTSPDVLMEITAQRKGDLITEKDTAPRVFTIHELKPDLRLESSAAPGKIVDYTCTSSTS